MTWFLILIAVVVLIVWAARRKTPDPLPRSQPLGAAAPPMPRVVALSPLAKPAPSNVLQPLSPIPLTIEGASPEAVASLRRILEDERSYGRDRQERLLEWLLTTNARVKEIDAFLAEWGPKFALAVK